LALLRMEVAAFHPLPEKEATRLCGPVPRLRPDREVEGYCGRALPGILLCGARTFLSPGSLPGAATIWPASRIHYTAKLRQASLGADALASANEQTLAP